MSSVDGAASAAGLAAAGLAPALAAGADLAPGAAAGLSAGMSAGGGAASEERETARTVANDAMTGGVRRVMANLQGGMRTGAWEPATPSDPRTPLKDSRER